MTYHQPMLAVKVIRNKVKLADKTIKMYKGKSSFRKIISTALATALTGMSYFSSGFLCYLFTSFLESLTGCSAPHVTTGHKPCLLSASTNHPHSDPGLGLFVQSLLPVAASHSPPHQLNEETMHWHKQPSHL